MPFSKSPVSAQVPKPEPIAAPPAAVNHVPPASPGRKAPPNKLPNIAPINASGCPVSGLMVIGIIDANPSTSLGLTCISMVSP